MVMIDPRLQLFRAVMLHGTITSAAETLFRSPSGISRQLRDLSDDLGVELFEVDGRKIKPTPTAHLLLEHVEQLLRLWEITQVNLRAQDDDIAGNLRIGAFATALTALCPQVVSSMARDFPRLRVRVIEAEPAECFDYLLEGEIDAALVYVTPDTPETDDARYASMPLYREPIDLLVASGDELAEKTAVSLADAVDRPWIVGPPQHSGSRQIITACQAAGFTPRVVHEAHGWNSVAALVGEGLGVSVVSRLARTDSAPKVVRVPLTGTAAPSRTILAYTRAGAERAPATVELISRIVEDAKSLLAQRRTAHSGTRSEGTRE